MENIEVELKFPLINFEDTIEKLNKTTIFKKEEYQKDIYFIPFHRNFLDKKPISEWLRIRQTKEGFSFNYKNWHNTDNLPAVSCDEFETNFENLNALKSILEKLNYKEMVTVEKTRNSYEFKKVKIAVDEVTGLGYFIELEANGDFSDVEEAKKHLYGILEELNINVGEQNFKGYPHLMLEKKGLI